MAGHWFHFNPVDPDLVFVAAQDYNGALTGDGGHTWAYANVSGKGWGGNAYGGFAVSRDLLIAGYAPKWHGPRKVAVSRDGGKAWTHFDDAQWTGDNQPGDDGLPHGYQSSYADPDDLDTLFCGPYRSTDAGRSWRAMAGCSAVLGHHGDRLLGTHWRRDAQRGEFVTSTDAGATWEAQAEFEGELADADFDPVHDAYYLVIDHHLHRLRDGEPSKLDTPRDHEGQHHLKSVAVDPNRPEVVYATYGTGLYAPDPSVIRSLDAGETWHAISAQRPLGPGVVNGAHDATQVNVHPETGWAWVTTGCYGIWKHPPPENAQSSDRGRRGRGVCPPALSGRAKRGCHFLNELISSSLLRDLLMLNSLRSFLFRDSADATPRPQPA